MAILLKRLPWLLLALAVALGMGTALAWWQFADRPGPLPGNNDFTAVVLSAPVTDGSMSLEKAMFKRRSVSDFGPLALEFEEISQLAWAAQGITDSDGMLRTAPSADRAYRLTLYLAAQNVNGLDPGIYKYDPYNHQLQGIIAGNKSFALLLQVKQPVVEHAAAVFIIAGPDISPAEKNHEQQLRFVNLECGHIAQNLLLQATALNLGSLPMGSFSQSGIKKLLLLEDEENVYYLVAIGNNP